MKKLAKKQTTSKVTKRVPLKKAQKGGTNTMKEYVAKYPESSSDTLAANNPNIRGNLYYGFAGNQQQADLNAAHKNKYGDYIIGLKPAPSPSTADNLLMHDYYIQQQKKGGSTKASNKSSRSVNSKGIMKKGGSVKKKK